MSFLQWDGRGTYLNRERELQFRACMQCVDTINHVAQAQAQPKLSLMSSVTVCVLGCRDGLTSTRGVGGGGGGGWVGVGAVLPYGQFL